MAEAVHQVHQFEPVYDGESRILILGTFPSVKSRENGFYYGHPRNRFWKVMAAVTGSGEPHTVAEKRKMLLENRIALWDVVASCDIAGSSDASITNVIPTDIRRILSGSRIERICANGTAAKRLYDIWQKKQCGREIILLPSTSPANAAWSLPQLIRRWTEVLRPEPGVPPAPG